MAPPTRRYLGIDPGTRTAGWGLVEYRGNSARMVDCGAIRTRGPQMAQRLRELHDGLAGQIARLEPDAVAIETPFLGKNARTAFAIGMARGIALLAAAERDLPVHEYSPAMVKKAVVGNGAASKEQVGAMIRVILGLAELPKPEDAADALAIAVTHAHRAGPNGLAGRAR